MRNSELHRQRITQYLAEGRTVSGGSIDDNEDSGGFDTAGLIESLTSNALQAYDTTQALNSNPLNTALVYGGAVSTPQGSALSGSGSPIGGNGMTTLLLLLGAGAIIVFVAIRR
jgi:hypothetical protein